MNVSRYVAVVHGWLLSQELRWTVHLFYRMGVISIAYYMGNTSDSVARYHECVVFFSMLVAIHHRFCFLFLVKYRPEIFGIVLTAEI